MTFLKGISAGFRVFPSREEGSAILELAVAIPILLLVAVGAADFARVYATGITVANAARTGAQFGAHTAGDTAAMRIAAETDAGTVALDTVTAVRVCRCPDVGVVDCSTGDCGAYGVPQAYDSVRVRKEVTLIIPYPGLPSSIVLIKSVVFRAQ
jgi:Flp pilus assembly protein TadG